MVRSRAVSTVTVLTMVNQLTEVVGPNRTIAPMIVPPDGGWGWVVVMVGLLGACCLDGCVYCFYLYREPMSKDLHIHESDISYLSSLNTGFYFVGVFACSFGNHWGFRMTMMIGAIVTSLAYASGYILQEIIYFYIIIGVIGGMGSGFMSVGGGLPASFYFDKKRSIALGIVSCGSGLGGVVMPHIIELFMRHYGWRNTFLFEAGIMAFSIFLAALIRPLKPVMVVINAESSRTTLRPRDESIMDFSAFRIPSMPPDMVSTASMRRSVAADVTSTAQPTIAQMADDVSLINIQVKSFSNTSLITRLHEMTQSRRPSQVLPTSASAILFNNIRISQEPFIQQKLPWYKCGCFCPKYATLPGRPLMRDDLYYTGSLLRLEEYTGKDRDLEYHMEVTRVPTYYQTVQDLTKSYTIWCCHNIFTGLHYLVDYRMFKSPAFDCLALCGFAVYMAFYSPFIFFKVHMEDIGAGEYASTLVSFVGLGSMIGRFLSGIIIKACPRFDARTVVIFMLLVSGVSIMCMVQLNNLYFKSVCMFVFGFSIGFYVPLRSLIIVDFFGLQKLTSATGVLILCLGVGSFLGPPVAESVMDYTKDKTAPFYVCGISLVLGSMMLLPMKKLSNFQKKRARQKELQRSQT